MVELVKIVTLPLGYPAIEIRGELDVINQSVLQRSIAGENLQFIYCEPRALVWEYVVKVGDQRVAVPELQFQWRRLVGRSVLLGLFQGLRNSDHSKSVREVNCLHMFSLNVCSGVRRAGIV